MLANQALDAAIGRADLRTFRKIYGLCQGMREACRVEFGLVGVDRPGGPRDAPSEDHVKCSSTHDLDENQFLRQVLSDFGLSTDSPQLADHCR